MNSRPAGPGTYSGHYLESMQVEMLKVFQQPLVLHSEAVEQGNLTQLERWVVMDTVGWRTLKTGVQETKVYWIKRHTQDKLSPKVKRTPQRPFVSPLLTSHTPKRPCLGHTHNVAKQQVDNTKTLLEKEVKDKEGRLQKLKLAKLYRTKNNLPKLDKLIAKWRQVSQEAVEDLISVSTRSPPPTTQQLLDYLHINHTLIHYSTEQDSFY